VQQQTDFVALHIAEIQDANLPPHERHKLAASVQYISLLIHKVGIRDSKWYDELLAALDQNIQSLERFLMRRKRVLIRRPSQPAS
jgi:hypothetical protein